MKNPPMSPLPGLRQDVRPDAFPGEAELAALRGWYAGLSSRESVARYLAAHKVSGQSSRGMLGQIRRQLISIARQRHRADLVVLLDHPESERIQHARTVGHAIDALRTAPEPTPRITDDVSLWLSARSTNALYAQGIETLAQLTVRVPRRRRWWTVVSGLGTKGARQIEAFFAAHPQLTERARELVVSERTQTIVPWERLEVPDELNGSRGSFRAPPSSCTLSADNDYEAVQAWLALHESSATKRAYRKEAERLILWAIVERGRALSSLTTEDATAYRGFLRNPTPRSRWVGPPQTRFSSEWRPFAAGLSPRSTAYALTVIGAMFRWLIEQRYVLASRLLASKCAVAVAARPWTKGVYSPRESGRSFVPWRTGWSGLTGGKCRRPKGCALCWTSLIPPGYVPVRLWVRAWGRLKRMSRATTG